jgi:acyl-CoA synthetase (AMP-forming)/AMP-acid ligase II
VAVVQLHPGRDISPDDLQAFVKDRIGGVKTPKLIEVWPDLPRSSVGKVLKKEICGQMLNRAATKR